jgi:hypothetical protein
MGARRDVHASSSRITSRRHPGFLHTRAVRTTAASAGIALGALISTAAPDAAADGERSPMFGGSLVGVRRAEPQTEVVGVALEAAWWHGRLGFALEGSARWSVEGGEPRATVLGASARLRVFECLVPALLEPRDVELGVELHGIAERTWWGGDLSQDNPLGYGLGLGIRLRGDSDNFPSILTESRLVVRVLSSPRPADELAALAMSPAETRARETTILFGLGAAFGVGEPGYLDRFRPRATEVVPRW